MIVALDGVVEAERDDRARHLSTRERANARESTNDPERANGLESTRLYERAVDKGHHIGGASQVLREHQPMRASQALREHHAARASQCSREHHLSSANSNRPPTEAAYSGLASPDLRQAFHAPLERLGAWPANQFEGAEASRIVPAIHPLAANLTVGVVCVKRCCGESLSIDGPAPALVVPDEFSPASAHGSLSQSGLCSMLSSNSDRRDDGLARQRDRSIMRGK